MNNNKLVLYYANWCGACVNYKPEWNALKQILNKNGVKTKEYEETQNKQIMEKELINSYPTLKIHYGSGDTKVLQSRDINYVLSEFNITPNQMGGGGCGCRTSKKSKSKKSKSKKSEDENYKKKYQEYKKKYINLKKELINQHK